MITGPITYRLSRPVTSVDREVVELSLREPTGLDGPAATSRTPGSRIG